MSKMSFDGLTRHALNGPTMGTRWQALFWLPDGQEAEQVQADMASAVARIDDQMSLWKPESDLCRLNRAPVGNWVDLGAEITQVLQAALRIGARTGWAFDIAVGGTVAAWGFGPEAADQDAIGAALRAPRVRAGEALELDVPNRKARRMADCRFDLNGIAKGYGTDCLVKVAADHGITGVLAGLDGDLRAAGTRPDGSAWPVAIEAPEYDRREAARMIEITDLAVATSGDYRHWVDVAGQRLSHTVDPVVGAPVIKGVASVTVLAATGAEADAWATALMVLGEQAGVALARANQVQAMFMRRPEG